MQPDYSVIGKRCRFRSAWTWNERHRRSVQCPWRTDHPWPFLLAYSCYQRKYGRVWYHCGTCAWSFPVVLEWAHHTILVVTGSLLHFQRLRHHKKFRVRLSFRMVPQLSAHCGFVCDRTGHEYVPSFQFVVSCQLQSLPPHRRHLCCSPRQVHRLGVQHVPAEGVP